MSEQVDEQTWSGKIEARLEAIESKLGIGGSDEQTDESAQTAGDQTTTNEENQA